MEKYPAFQNLPENYIGIEDQTAGVVHAKKSISAF